MVFGQGLVATPSNFGQLGQQPTHPELLDELAVFLTQQHWSWKRLQRQMLLSETFQQTSHTNQMVNRMDPDNRWYSHMVRRRLDVEAWRDTILAVCDQLDLQLGGPSIQPQDPKQRRRTVYSRISRLELDRMLALFDFPDPNAHSARRATTTTPLQKLFVLNSPFMVTNAQALTQLLLAGPFATDAQRVRRAYGIVFARMPSSEELQAAVDFINSSAGDALAAWTTYAQVLLACNELMMID